MASRLPAGFALLLAASCSLDSPRQPAGFQLSWLDELPVGAPYTQVEVQAWGLRHGFVAGCPGPPSGYEYDNANIGRGSCGFDQPIAFEDRGASLRFEFVRIHIPDSLYLELIELEAAIPDILELDGTRARSDVVARAARDAWGPPYEQGGSVTVWRLCDRFVRVEQRMGWPPHHEVEILEQVPREDADREACVSARKRPGQRVQGEAPD